MSFLFQDEVFAKLLINSGVFEELVKQAQQISNEAKTLAVKLTQNLMEQAKQESGVNDATDVEIYIKDLVDLDTYLQFLQRNEQRFGNKLIVYRDPTGTSPPPTQDKKLYTPFKEYYVLKNGLLDELHKLDVASRQAGNEVMKPLIKNLISQINNAFSTSYEAQDKLPDNPYQAQDTVDKTKNLRVKEQNQYKNVGYNPEDESEDSSDPNYKNVSDKTKVHQSQISQEDTSQLINALPFQNENAISPYDMTLFIRNTAQFLNKYQEFIKGPMLGYFQQANANITNNWHNWQTFINSKVGENPSGNLQSLRDNVPYDRGNRPITYLTTLFGSEINAKAAAQRLLQMVSLTQQTLMTIRSSHEMMQLLGEDRLNHQLTQARAFIESLTPFTRS